MFLERLPEFIGNHPLLSLAFAGIGVALLVNELTRFTRGYKAVSPAQLTLLINREDALVLDVSALADYQKGHITGARHQPLRQLDPQAKPLAAARERPVALVDRTGLQSAQAARKLAKAGFPRVYWLDGGRAAWQQADLPLARK